MTDYVHVLRTCAANMTSHGGFRWPEAGPVEAPDWSDDGECGGGLHGLLRGEGDGGLLNWNSVARWLVVRVRAADVRDLGDKVKFPRGEVVHVGDRHSAAALIASLHPEARAIVGYTATAGFGGTATSGDYGTSTSGDYGRSTSGYYGTSTAGDYGTSTSGYGGTSTSGDRGTSTSGEGGTAASGDGGIIVIWRYAGGRRRLVVGYVGENGIKPNVAYKLNNLGEFVEASRHD
jgi:hypothetical protein